MAKNLTEDAVRDLARDILGLVDSDAPVSGSSRRSISLGSQALLISQTAGICPTTRRKSHLFWRRRRRELPLARRRWTRC